MKTAERFASVVNGKLVALTEATPPHELKSNQIELTKDEFMLLKAFPFKSDGIDIVECIEILLYLQDKMIAVGNG